MNTNHIESIHKKGVRQYAGSKTEFERMLNDAPAPKGIVFRGKKYGSYLRLHDLK